MSWWHDALCIGSDKHDESAKSNVSHLCAGCPVAVPCLSDALKTEWTADKSSVMTVRAGLTGRQRWHLIRAIRNGTKVPSQVPAWAVLVTAQMWDAAKKQDSISKVA